MQTFSRPLQKPSSGQFYGVSTDYAAIAKAYRERFGGNPFGIKPDGKPLQPCTNKGCTAAFNPNTGLWLPGCSGECCF